MRGKTLGRYLVVEPLAHTYLFSQNILSLSPICSRLAYLSFLFFLALLYVPPSSVLVSVYASKYATLEPLVWRMYV